MLDLRKVFGVEARITTSAQESGGALVEMECTAHPGSGTMVHFHPEQDEEFEVLSGSLELFGDGQWTTVPAGAARTVGRGTIHAWRNTGTVPVRFRNVHRPALGFEASMPPLTHYPLRGNAGNERGVRNANDPASPDRTRPKGRPWSSRSGSGPSS